MKDIIKRLNLQDVSTADINDMVMLMYKAKAIVRWMEDGCDKESADYFREVSHVIERYVIIGKDNDDKKQIFGIIFPIVKYVENFYNANAEKYEPEQTPEQINMKLISGKLFDTMCKVQTMQQDNWTFDGNKHKAFLFNGFNFASEGYINVLDKSEILDKDICDEIEQMNNMVNKEFNKFWRCKQSKNNV